MSETVSIRQTDSKKICEINPIDGRKRLCAGGCFYKGQSCWRFTIIRK